MEDYLARLAGYAHCVMGRRTDKFGYRFGLVPGANPYPGMETAVVSSTLKLPEDAHVAVVRDGPLAYVDDLKRRAAGPIYLCGGGVLAGALLAAGRIDLLRLKRAPILLGGGVRLFASGVAPTAMRLRSARDYGDGVLYQEFDLT